MKYAVISDIHGNLEALETVPSDAEAQRVDGYILLGDYCLSNPEPDACVTRIRNLPNAYVIRGNEERYTILELTDGTVRVEERRLPFDFTAYVERFRQSRQYREAPVWSKVIARQLSQSRDCLVFFLQFVERYAQQIGDDRRPYVRETWEQAYALWESAISP